MKQFYQQQIQKLLLQLFQQTMSDLQDYFNLVYESNLLGALILIGVSLVGYVCGEELWREYKSVPASKAPKARKSKKK